MSTNRTRPTWFGMPGEDFPSSPFSDSRGALGIKDPSSGDDIAAVCLRRSTGELEWVELALAEDLAYVEAPPWRSTQFARGVLYSVVSNGNGTTLSTSGGSAPTVTVAGSQTDGDTGFAGSFLQMSTAATLNTVGQITFGAPADAIRSGWDPWFDAVVSTTATMTSIRHWLGFFSSTPSGSGDPVISGFGFRFDTGQGDTVLNAWSNDGSSGGLATATSVAWTSNTVQRLSAAVDGNGTRIRFYRNDELLATHTTNLPVTSTYLQGGLYVTTLNGSQKAVQLGRFTCGYVH